MARAMLGAAGSVSVGSDCAAAVGPQTVERRQRRALASWSLGSCDAVQWEVTWADTTMWDNLTVDVVVAADNLAKDGTTTGNRPAI